MQFPNYDQEIRSILPYYDSYHSETINLIKATGLKPKTWLDTGCGTGSLVELALKHFPDTQFILADPSAEMLIEAKRKLYGSKKVIFLNPTSTQDLIKEPISRPDIITAIQCHHYLSNEARIKATKVCYDLLVKDGIYVTFENIRPMTKVG